jgi:glycosyltransferase involved in cell wall biosynthesis/2-polyprenyl-3-methyl-5-hydroxy-6-metoxy-1,4-benzoquinol methylase
MAYKMFIVMHCGGMPFNGETLVTKSLGGSETAAYYMARELARAGHKVTLFTNTREGGEWDGVKYLPAGEITEQEPLGQSFHFYAMNTPHDVLIIQRHPLAFRCNWACKVGLWWLHDLALGRMRDHTLAQLWNMDGILSVSNWHKNQITETWGINPEAVYPIQNGVDLSLYARGLSDQPPSLPLDKFKMLYAARPERGLINLLKEGGIMERLAEVLPSAHLYTCTYDNAVPQFAPLYSYLAVRAKVLPNVTQLAPMPKQQLAETERQCDLYVYPTEFEDTSCIMMMECAAAGLPVLASDIAALPETTKGGGAYLLPVKDGAVDIEEWVNEIVAYAGKELAPEEKRAAQLAIAPRFDWSVAAGMLLEHVATIFKKKQSSTGAVLRDLIQSSDIYAADRLLKEKTESTDPYRDPIVGQAATELADCYAFARNNTFAEHYAAYYEYEKNRGVNYGPETLDGNLRYEHVASLVRGLPAGSVVLDYGCAHGHYTVNLAKRFPHLQFVGIDIAESNIAKARQWTANEGLANVHFHEGAVADGKINSPAGLALWADEPKLKFDAIIAAEILEHVTDPGALARTLADYLSPSGLLIITTPFGPWEAQGYREHYPWRAHLHHLERADLHELFGKWPDFHIVVAPSGHATDGSPLGSYISTMRNPGDLPVGKIDYARKLALAAPRRQTVSACMIVRNVEQTLLRTLESLRDVVDEIVVAIDHTTTDRTKQIVEQFKEEQKLWPVVHILEIPSPLDIGFAAARNLSIADACGDWVLWIDGDEILVHADRLGRYLRNNAFDGYAMKQHHFAIEPLGVQKTDLPCRLFRNRRGVRFFGTVHEHPEKEMNKGVGYALLIPDIDIAHSGYTTEVIRQARFQRNLPLLVRDREENPDRILGKFLWIRDLSQMCMWEAKHIGKVSPNMISRARTGVELYETLLNDESVPVNMLQESTEFYSALVSILDQGAMEVAYSIGTSKLNGGTHPEAPRTARFIKPEHAEKLLARVYKDKVKPYESKYY